MALPQVSTPTYELTVPSTGEKVSYRPFLVKEEKILMMAMESGDTAGMTKAMKDIITSCTDGEVNTKDLDSDVIVKLQEFLGGHIFCFICSFIICPIICLLWSESILISLCIVGGLRYILV